MIVNATGATVTAVVTVIFAITKFHDGAWVVILVIPALVAVFYAIHRHYRRSPGSSRSRTSARRRASTATA